MRLLDVAPIPDDFLLYQEWLRKHTKDVVDTVSNGTVVPEGSEPVADTLDAGQAFIGHMGNSGDDASTMVWAVLAVVAALALCLLFVRSYRRSSHRSLAGA